VVAAKEQNPSARLAPIIHSIISKIWKKSPLSPEARKNAYHNIRQGYYLSRKKALSKENHGNCLLTAAQEEIVLGFIEALVYVGEKMSKLRILRIVAEFTDRSPSLTWYTIILWQSDSI
jgi:hypothetical protein